MARGGRGSHSSIRGSSCPAARLVLSVRVRRTVRQHGCEPRGCRHGENRRRVVPPPRRVWLQRDIQWPAAAPRRASSRVRAGAPSVARIKSERARAQIAPSARHVPFHDLLAASDVVSVHCPLSAATARLFDAAAFSKMKPSAIFVNTSRCARLRVPQLRGAATIRACVRAGAGWLTRMRSSMPSRRVESLARDWM